MIQESTGATEGVRPHKGAILRRLGMVAAATACTCTITTFVSAALHEGFRPQLISRWWHTFIVAWPCVVPVMYVLLPRIQEWFVPRSPPEVQSVR